MPPLKDAIGYLYGLQKSGIRPGLERIKRLLALLNNPQMGYPSILVAGTNGKGSTARMLSTMLTQAGYRTALYTSPHLLRFNERISIDNKEIGGRELARLIWRLKELVEKDMSHCPPTFFEFSTAMAFEYFRQKRADMAVIEVGMGGKFDATNVVNPLVGVITSVGYDHTEYLGRTLKEIAHQKAGIIKRGMKVVTAADDREAKRVIERVSKDMGVPLYGYGRDFTVEKQKSGGFVYRGEATIRCARPGLKGDFQLKNAGCAIKVVELLSTMGYEVSKDAIVRGMENTRWRARFQVIGTHPLVVLDCAHNPEGAVALRKSLEGIRFRRLILVTGMMKDKDIDAIMGNLSGVASTIVCTRPAYWRSEEPERLKAIAERYGKETMVRRRVGQAVAAALELADSDDAICVTGSIFTVAEALRYLERKGYTSEP